MGGSCEIGTYNPPASAAWVTKWACVRAWPVKCVHVDVLVHGLGMQIRPGMKYFPIPMRPLVIAYHDAKDASTIEVSPIAHQGLIRHVRARGTSSFFPEPLVLELEGLLMPCTPPLKGCNTAGAELPGVIWPSGALFSSPLPKGNRLCLPRVVRDRRDARPCWVRCQQSGVKSRSTVSTRPGGVSVTKVSATIEANVSESSQHGVLASHVKVKGTEVK